jgi:endoglucanase
MYLLQNAHAKLKSRLGVITRNYCRMKVLLMLMMAFSLYGTSYSQCFLEARGTQITTSTGVNVILRGVNLGDWAIQEGYFLHPQLDPNPVNCQWKMKKKYYDQGQTEAQVEAFYASWRNNFITKADIDYIASLGFNCVRLPLHYELFLTASQRSWRNQVIKNIGYHDTYKANLQGALNNNQLFNDPNLDGFVMINNILNWCASNGMYVILDLHAAPGGQGADQNISDLFYANDLWNQQVFKDVTVRLWERLAAKYKGDARIAFYDLINEPNQVPSNQVIHDLFQRLITAVRNQGDNHILMIEGNGWGNNYDYLEPYTFSPNWGLVYNAHRYWINASDDWIRDGNPNQINRMINLVEFRQRHNVPVFVGETGENTNDWLKQNISWMEEYGIGWAHWTYKRHDVGENAALMRIGGSYPYDGASVMSSVLEQIKYVNNIKNTNTIAAVTAKNPAPWTTGCYNGGSPAPQPPVGMTVTLKGPNNLYVTSNNGTSPMWCNSSNAAGTWEKFLVVGVGNNKVALKSMGKFVSSENGATTGITCNRTSPGGWEVFTWEQVGSNQVGFKGSNNQYISSENGASVMKCNRATRGGWETFTYGYTSAGRSATNAEMEGEEPAMDNSELTVFPNPSAGKVTIRVSRPSSIHIMDIAGKSVLNAHVNESLTVDMLTGLYIVRMHNELGSQSRKLAVK